MTTRFTGQQTLDSQRRREIAIIKAKHADQQEYPPWITEADDENNTTHIHEAGDLQQYQRIRIRKPGYP